MTRALLEIGQPGAFRYVLGVIVMLAGVVLPLAYSALRKNKAKTALPTRPVARQQST